VFGDAASSYLRPTMKPVMFCRNSSGILVLVAQLDLAPLLGGPAEQHPVVGDNTHRMPVDACESGDEGPP
jgi:hypothetical protein